MLDMQSAKIIAVLIIVVAVMITGASIIKQKSIENTERNYNGTVAINLSNDLSLSVDAYCSDTTISVTSVTACRK